jgi:hypothetical protein
MNFRGKEGSKQERYVAVLSMIVPLLIVEVAYALFAA